MALVSFGRVLLLSVGLVGCSLDTGEEQQRGSQPTQPDEVEPDPQPSSPTPTGVVPFAVDAPGVYDMDVDATHLYWVEAGMFSHVASVRRMPLDGGPVETLLTVPATVYSIDVADGFVYAASTTGGPDYDGHIYRVPVDGGEATIIANGFNPTSVSVDDCWVYYSEGISSGGRIWRVHTTGGTPQAVVNDVNNPWDLVADGGTLFYSEMNSARIMRVVPGHTPTELATNPGWVGTNWLTVDASHVYFSTCPTGMCASSDVSRVARDGGPTEWLWADLGNESKLAVTDGKLVWGARLIPTSGGSAQPLGGDGTMIAVTTTATYAYFADWMSGKIYRAPL